MCRGRQSIVCPYAVLFDLDDTLYPERSYVHSGFRAVAHYLGEVYQVNVVDAYQRLCESFEHGERGENFNVLLRHLGIPVQVELIRQLVEVYRTHEPELKLYPDAERVLTLLRPGFRLGLLTDGYLTVQRLKVRVLHLVQRFDAIVYTDAWGREHWKPSIMPFESLLERLEVAPHRTVYVGDNPRKDFKGPRQMGMATVRVVRPATEHSGLLPESGYEADFEVNTLDLLPLLLREIFPNKEKIFI